MKLVFATYGGYLIHVIGVFALYFKKSARKLAAFFDALLLRAHRCEYRKRLHVFGVFFEHGNTLRLGLVVLVADYVAHRHIISCG